MNWRVLDDVQTDLDLVVRRLERERRGFGLAFSDLYDLALAAIRSSPRQYSPTEDGPDGIETREVFIERFHQRVIYAVTDTEIVILAVEHAHRRPGAWVGRVEQM